MTTRNPTWKGANDSPPGWHVEGMPKDGPKQEKRPQGIFPSPPNRWIWMVMAG